MKRNSGVTLINMMIIILVIIIISSVSIIGGRQLLEDSKESQKKENLASVQAVVNSISLKYGMSGTLTPGNMKLYGQKAVGILSGDSATLEDWYILDVNALEEMGIEYTNEEYIVNYRENRVISMSEYRENGFSLK